MFLLDLIVVLRSVMEKEYNVFVFILCVGVWGFISDFSL